MLSLALLLDQVAAAAVAANKKHAEEAIAAAAAAKKAAEDAIIAGKLANEARQAAAKKVSYPEPTGLTNSLNSTVYPSLRSTFLHKEPCL